MNVEKDRALFMNKLREEVQKVKGYCVIENVLSSWLMKRQIKMNINIKEKKKEGRIKRKQGYLFYLIESKYLNKILGKVFFNKKCVKNFLNRNNNSNNDSSYCCVKKIIQIKKKNKHVVIASLSDTSIKSSLHFVYRGKSFFIFVNISHYVNKELFNHTKECSDSSIVVFVYESDCTRTLGDDNETRSYDISVRNIHPKNYRSICDNNYACEKDYWEGRKAALFGAHEYLRKNGLCGRETTIEGISGGIRVEIRGETRGRISGRGCINIGGRSQGEKGSCSSNEHCSSFSSLYKKERKKEQIGEKKGKKIDENIVCTKKYVDRYLLLINYITHDTILQFSFIKLCDYILYKYLQHDDVHKSALESVASAHNEKGLGTSYIFRENIRRWFNSERGSIYREATKRGMTINRYILNRSYTNINLKNGVTYHYVTNKGNDKLEGDNDEKLLEETKLEITVYIKKKKKFNSCKSYFSLNMFRKSNADKKKTSSYVQISGMENLKKISDLLIQKNSHIYIYSNRLKREKEFFLFFNNINKCFYIFISPLLIYFNKQNSELLHINTNEQQKKGSTNFHLIIEFLIELLYLIREMFVKKKKLSKKLQKYISNKTLKGYINYSSLSTYVAVKKKRKMGKIEENGIKKKKYMCTYTFHTVTENYFLAQEEDFSLNRKLFKKIKKILRKCSHLNKNIILNFVEKNLEKVCTHVKDLLTWCSQFSAASLCRRGYNIYLYFCRKELTPLSNAKEHSEMSDHIISNRGKCRVKCSDKYVGKSINKPSSKCSSIRRDNWGDDTSSHSDSGNKDELRNRGKASTHLICSFKVVSRMDKIVKVLKHILICLLYIFSKLEKNFSNLDTIYKLKCLHYLINAFPYLYICYLKKEKLKSFYYKKYIRHSRLPFFKHSMKNTYNKHMLKEEKRKKKIYSYFQKCMNVLLLSNSKNGSFENAKACNYVHTREKRKKEVKEHKKKNGNKPKKEQNSGKKNDIYILRPISMDKHYLEREKKKKGKNSKKGSSNYSSSSQLTTSDNVVYDFTPDDKQTEQTLVKYTFNKNRRNENIFIKDKEYCRFFILKKMKRTVSKCGTFLINKVKEQIYKKKNLFFLNVNMHKIILIKMVKHLQCEAKNVITDILKMGESSMMGMRGCGYADGQHGDDPHSDNAKRNDKGKDTNTSFINHHEAEKLLYLVCKKIRINKNFSVFNIMNVLIKKKKNVHYTKIPNIDDQIISSFFHYEKCSINQIFEKNKSRPYKITLNYLVFFINGHITCTVHNFFTNNYEKLTKSQDKIYFINIQKNDFIKNMFVETTLYFLEYLFSYISGTISFIRKGEGTTPAKKIVTNAEAEKDEIEKKEEEKNKSHFNVCKIFCYEIEQNVCEIKKIYKVKRKGKFFLNVFIFSKKDLLFVYSYNKKNKSAIFNPFFVKFLNQNELYDVYLDRLNFRNA
ncbi:conserved Plasmodium protein, unknown function [Plasmodium malariae]|uniref:Uncharacterized protein n=1 Tax=Plasmodium malariae TaxID=5858 RepID=A0A1A8WSY8_PLAMA|nr:conserved Plasmodium protein, unknown function [Plasmodium malariae]